MANYSTLKAAIDQYITANGNNEITGTVLNNVLDAMVNSLGANYQFAGVATPSTNPGSPDQNVFYLAFEGGTYTNFGGAVLPDGISILKWNGSWSSQTVSYNDGGVFDISAYHATGGTLAKYSDLAAALGNGGTNIPVDARKGGMSVKFVQSSDNKYIQARLMTQSFTTDITLWQTVDDEPTAESDNLVKSGGVTTYSKKAVLSKTGKFNSLFSEFCILGNSFDITDITSMYIDRGNLRSSGKYRSGITLKIDNSEVFSYYADYETLAEAQNALTSNRIIQLYTSSAILYVIFSSAEDLPTTRTTFNVELTDACVKKEMNPIIDSYLSKLSGEQFIFKNRAINNDGEEVENTTDHIMCTGFIPVQEGKTIEIYGRNSSVYPLVAFFDSDYQFIEKQNGIDNHIILTTLPNGTAFIRCNGSTTEGRLNGILIDGLVFCYMDWLQSSIKDIYSKIMPEPTPSEDLSIDFSDIDWSVNSVNDAGEITSTYNRITNLTAIDVRNYDTISIYNDSTYLCNIVRYKKDGSVTKESDFAGGDLLSQSLKDTNYIRLLFKLPNNEETILSDFESATANCSVELKIYTLLNEPLHNLSVGFQNIRKFSTSGNTPGCPDVATYMPQWKESISKWLNQDFLLIGEWTPYFDRSEEINAYDTLIKQFYPYKFEFAGNALFSKIPVVFSSIKIDYYQMIASFEVNNKKIAIVQWGHSNQATVQQRESAYTRMISYLSDFDIAIVAGDFNNDVGAEELAVWTQAGYTLGNNGYWGQIDTCTTSTNPNFAAIDNIITKGVIFDCFDKGDAIITSDHYPVRGEFKY